nr:hypothetical protein [uncultured Acinetobacter sp.]
MNLIYFHGIVIAIAFSYLVFNYVILLKSGQLSRFVDFISDPVIIEEYWSLQKSKLIRHLII